MSDDISAEIAFLQRIVAEGRPVSADDLFLYWLIQWGFRDPKPIGDGRWAAIQPMAYTHRLSVGRIGDRTSIEDGWCYHSYNQAKVALDAWDGQDEPVGWHRHPRTWRRVSQSPDERDEDGREVGAVGVMYRRR